MKRRAFQIVLSVILSVLISSCKSTPDENTTWTDLFNGENVDNWIVKIHHYEVGENFGQTFRAEDGIIKVRYDEYEGDFNDRFGHLYYEKPYSNFHLKLEYQFEGHLHPGAPEYTVLNSGVMFHSQDPRTMPKEQNWPISVEMQFLAGLPDGRPRPTGNMCSPGTDIEYKGTKYDGHCLNSSSETYQPTEWISAELIVWGDSLIQHIINGDTVLEYSRPTMGGGVVDGYDSAIWRPGTPLTSGFIALQSEGQPINFRNVRIRELR